MKILVTGGSGFIGSHIAELLAKEKNNKIFIPDTKIKDNHVNVISNVCPKSGCDINNNKTGRRNAALKKYFKYSFLLPRDKIVETIIIKKGFKISVGWNLGRKGRSNHLLDPLTSIPISKTNTKVINVIKNRITEILIKISWFKNEKNIKIIIPIKIKIKCFRKK